MPGMPGGDGLAAEPVAAEDDGGGSVFGPGSVAVAAAFPVAELAPAVAVAGQEAGVGAGPAGAAPGSAAAGG